MRKTNPILAVLGALLITGCAFHQKQVMEDMENPIDCSTAQADIKTLEKEKVRVGQQILAGVSAITPVGAVVGILTGTERTKLKVTIGEYNRLIEARIAAIKMKCNVQ